MVSKLKMLAPAFPITDLPLKAISPREEANSWCPDGFDDDLTQFDGTWQLESQKSDSTSPIMRILGHRGIAIRLMERYRPISHFHFLEDDWIYQTVTHLPAGRQVKGTFNMTGKPSRVRDDANNIDWYDVRSAWDAEEAVMYSIRESDKGTMYDVRRVCTDRRGNEYMYFIMSFLRKGAEEITRVDRWLRRVGF